jgi:hypothetical protein
MRITTPDGTITVTEEQLERLETRFVIRSRDGVRSFFVDEIEVSHDEYERAFMHAHFELDLRDAEPGDQRGSF